MVDVKNDELYKLLMAGTATADSQKDAAAWIETLFNAATEAHNFLTSPADVTPSQRIENAKAELADALNL
jgi:hypothetical protein